MEKVVPRILHEDNRGCIENISLGNWQEINKFTSKKGMKRGGHYHKKTVEILFVLEGKIEVRWENIKMGEKGLIEVNVNEGVKISPFEKHWAQIIEDTTWISMLSKRYDKDDLDVFE